MATITVSFVSVCAGGDHLVVNATLDGQPANGLRLDANELLTPLVVEDAQGVISNLLRVRWRGMTRAAARADLQAGISMTI